MTEIIKLKSLKKAQIVRKIKEGAVIIYPTDTVYGIGCDATNSIAVKRLRIVKNRDNKPMSVIAPSKQWIYSNFSIPAKGYIQRLPGPFTYLLKATKPNLVCKEVVEGNVVGVRIPDHPLVPVIQRAKTPFVTTSANISGEPVITRVEDLPKEISENVDLIIDGGKLGSQASTIIDLTGPMPRIIFR